MNLSDLRQRHIRLMQDTLGILNNVLDGVSQENATTLRDRNDGDQGWTVLETLCHLRDYDVIFQQRVRTMLAQDYPRLPGYDQAALAIERRYNEQNLSQVCAELNVSRMSFVELFRSLADQQWERAGVHPERGHFTMTDACAQVGTHEVIHIEQITRILHDGWMRGKY